MSHLSRVWKTLAKIQRRESEVWRRYHQEIFDAVEDSGHGWLDGESDVVARLPDRIRALTEERDRLRVFVESELQLHGGHDRSCQIHMSFTDEPCECFVGRAEAVLGSGPSNGGNK